jgi:hypothetical protein
VEQGTAADRRHCFGGWPVGHQCQSSLEEQSRLPDRQESYASRVGKPENIGVAGQVPINEQV